MRKITIWSIKNHGSAALSPLVTNAMLEPSVVCECRALLAFNIPNASVCFNKTFLLISVYEYKISLNSTNIP